MRGFCHFFAEKEKEKNPVEAGDLRPASGERGGRPELGEKVAKVALSGEVLRSQRRECWQVPSGGYF